MFPVELAYLSQSTSDYVQEAVKVVWGIHLQVLAITQAKAVSQRVTYLPFGQQARGDILVFLTGREEIDRCLSELADLIPTCVYTLDINLKFKFYRCHRLPKTASRMSLLPLYAGLPTEDQMRVFEAAEPGVRKVVLATNIAEASSLSTFARTFF